ncbi:MAG: 4Fe-4S binding protein, partial [Paracoccaceae bacterium]|nr:4Fe-4S binding protein [Paracoccaceae bacterium]
FEVRIDAFQEVVPGGRGAFGLSEPKNGATAECDIILDVSGGAALFSAPEKREGYLRADPGSLQAVSAAVVAASQLVGTFEKPLYVKLEEAICAHSRASKAGCSNCLNICPTGAITPNGDTVSIDPMICAGCGGCSAVCPSGAISYDAPASGVMFRRIEVLGRTYRKAGGKIARLLVTDQTHGREMVALAARFGRGLPADVIPLEVEALAGFGHAECLAALASGFSSVSILIGPKTERDALDQEIPLATAIAGEGKIDLLDIVDPEQLSAYFYENVALPAKLDPILPIGSRRQVARLAAQALRPEGGRIPLPEAAPYGAVLVDTDKCTLCLACVSLCPAGALGDSPDLPQLRFQEEACLQCGLCANICPEKAISLQPQMNLDDEALAQSVLHEEEPFACVECGSLFGVKSTVEKIVEKLDGKHSMFGNADAVRMIQMCDNCRVQAQFHSENNPLSGGERPKVRTTDDYFSKRKDH